MNEDLLARLFSDIVPWRYNNSLHTSPMCKVVLANNKLALLHILKNRERVKLRQSTEWTALHIAASEPKYLGCLELLLRFGNKIFLDVNGRTSNGRTALHIACENNCVEAVRRLLENGAKTYICDNYSRSAWHLAVLNGRIEILQMLLQSVRRERIEKYFSFKIPTIFPGNYIHSSLTCCAISSGNLDCLTALIASKLPRSILQSPTIIARRGFVNVYSPLAYLLQSSHLEPEKFDSFLLLLLKYEVMIPDMFKKQLWMYMSIWSSAFSASMRYENPFSAVFNDAWPLPKQQHYVDLLIANNVTSDYCLLCYGDTSQLLPGPGQGANLYNLYYKPVKDAVRMGKVDVVKLLMSNSVILEPDELTFHFWFCMSLSYEIESPQLMHQYLVSLKPWYYQRRYLPFDNFTNYQFLSRSEEFSSVTLQQLCRTAIRQQLRGRTLEDNLRDFRKRILELPLPSKLKDYLLFKD